MADSESIPLQAYPPGIARMSLQDSAEIEAQSSRSKSIFGNQSFQRIRQADRVSDLEERLKEEAENADDSEGFIRTYHTLKTKPLQEILQSIIWYHRFPSPETREQAVSFPEDLSQQFEETKRAGGISRLARVAKQYRKDRRTGKRKNKATFDTLLQELSSKIASAPENHSELCVITADDPTWHNAFSFSQKTKASFIGRDLPKMYKKPKLAALYVLKMHWHFGADLLNEILTVAPIPQSIGKQSILPSKVQPRNPVDIFQISDDPKSCLTLQWYSKCDNYIGDLDVYVWQNYGHPPTPEYLKLFMATGEGECSLRLIVVFKSRQSSRDFSELLFRPQEKAPSLTMVRGRQSAFKLVETVIYLFKLVADGNEVFIQQLRDQLEKLRYEGRKSPSGSKSQFLLHLNDCRLDALRCLDECLLLLSDTSISLSKHPVIEDQPKAKLQLELEVCRVDLTALVLPLKEADEEIEKTRVMIEQQLNLAQIRRQAVLALLAALYLPLAYVSGIFGMNITNTSLGLNKNSTNINYLLNQNDTDWINKKKTLDFTNLTQIQVYDILKVMSNSGNHAWDFKWYWITLIPLLFGSIVLPILAGPIIRYLLQNAARYSIYWRASCILLVIFYFIGIYGVLWNYAWGSSYGGYMDGFFPKFNPEEDWDDYWGNTGTAALITYYVFTAGAYSAVACYKVYWAWRDKHKRVHWTLFFLAVIILLTFRMILYNPPWIAFGSYYGNTYESHDAKIWSNETTPEFWIKTFNDTAQDANQEANEAQKEFDSAMFGSHGPLFTLDILNLLPWILLGVGMIWPGMRKIVKKIWKRKPKK